MTLGKQESDQSQILSAAWLPALVRGQSHKEQKVQ